MLFPSLEDLHHPGMESPSFALAGGFFTMEPQRVELVPNSKRLVFLVTSPILKLSSDPT